MLLQRTGSSRFRTVPEGSPSPGRHSDLDQCLPCQPGGRRCPAIRPLSRVGCRGPPAHGALRRARLPAGLDLRALPSSGPAGTGRPHRGVRVERGALLQLGHRRAHEQVRRLLGRLRSPDRPRSPLRAASGRKQARRSAVRPGRASPRRFATATSSIPFSVTWSDARPVREFRSSGALWRRPAGIASGPWPPPWAPRAVPRCSMPWA